MLNARKTLISIAIAASVCGVTNAQLLGGGAASSAASSITGGLTGSANGPRGAAGGVLGGTLGGGFGSATEAGAWGGFETLPGSMPGTDISGRARQSSSAAAEGVAGITSRNRNRAEEATVNTSESARGSAESRSSSLLGAASDLRGTTTARGQAATESAVQSAGEGSIGAMNRNSGIAIGGATQGDGDASVGPFSGAGDYEAEGAAEASRDNGVSARGAARGDASAAAER